VRKLFSWTHKAQAAIAACALALSSLCWGQQPDILWSRTYPEQNVNDEMRRLITLSDGGYLMGGKTVRGQEETYSNYGVVRLDSSFNMIWERTYGGFNPDSPSQNDVFGGFGEAPDGSIYIAGEWQGVNFAQIMRLNSAGDTLWSRNYGTTDFNDLNIGHDGYAVAAGVTVEYAEYGSWDAWLVKVDEDGEVIWQSVYGGGGTYSVESSRPVTVDSSQLEKPPPREDLKALS